MRAAVCLLPAALLLLPGCEPPKLQPGSTPPRAWCVNTVSHDDHHWVTYRDSIVHHPDCPCFKKKRFLAEGEAP